MTQRIASALRNFNAWSTSGLRELLGQLLQFGGEEYDTVGWLLAKWVQANHGGDDLIWNFLVRNVTPEDVRCYNLGNKLRCAPHHFGSDHGFLERQMRRSEWLLNTAITSLEDWNLQKHEGRMPVDGFVEGFLRKTSYSETHDKVDAHHVDAEYVLLHAIEAACLEQARADTLWWRAHEHQFRESSEGALRYFVLLAYTEQPSKHLAGIGAVLVDKDMLEYRWRFELHNLIHVAFHLLDEGVQDRVTSQILDLYADEDLQDGVPAPRVVMARRDLLAAIPSHLRSARAESLLQDACRQFGEPDVEPHIEMRSGSVGPPFSYEKFIEVSDEGILRILDHYRDNGRSSWEYDFLIGGRREVTTQLLEAASRLPSRFLPLLTIHWSRVASHFREAILSGVTSHLRYRFGNLSANNWNALETPSGPELAHQLLDELNAHPVYWQEKHEAAQAVEACASVVETQDDAEAIAFLLVGMLDAPDPGPDRQSGQGLIGIAINSTRGNAAEATLILTNRWAEAGRPLPELLAATLCRFAGDEHLAIRAVLLPRLPVLQYRMPELGWHVFALATENSNAEIWTAAERCLYHAYHQNFDLVAPHLERMFEAGAYESWGRIAALASLSGHIAQQVIRGKLLGVMDGAAWKGAVQVFASNAGQEEHRDACLDALSWALGHAPAPGMVIDEIHHRLFNLNPAIGGLSADFLRQFFSARNQATQEQHKSLHAFLEWVSAKAANAPDEALEALEVMLATEHRNPTSDLWQLTDASLLNRLFQDAEEREQSDGGGFLARVIVVQDALLRTGAYGLLDQWLKDAERP